MDALRAGFLLLGVFVHASRLGNDTVFDGIEYASSLFRMEGFFLISGFLSGMLVKRYGTRATVRRRMLRVGVPFLAALALCSPLTLWLAYNFHDLDVSLPRYLSGDAPASIETQTWHLHLWFLVSLLVFALCTPAAHALLIRLTATSAFAWVAATRLRTMTLITSFIVVATVVGRGAYRVAVEPVTASTPVDFLAKVTIEFLPFFLIGMVLYLNDQQLLAAFRRPAPLLLVVSGAAVLACRQEWVGPLASGTSIVITEAVFSVALLATLIAIADRLVPGERPAVRYVAEAAYTVYLFHYLWIYVIATAFSFGPDARWPQMLLVTLLAISVTLAIHHFVILRVGVLRTIFNGKSGAATVPVVRGRHPAAPPADSPEVRAREQGAAIVAAGSGGNSPGSGRILRP
jgi:glucan biosynthesis protein C